MEINISEEKEMNLIQQSILQLSASMGRLGVDLDVLSININFEDYEYIRRLILTNHNWSCSKFCKALDEEEVLSINGVKLKVK